MIVGKVESKEAISALTRLASATKKPIKDIVRQSARRLAANMAYQTQPFGDSEAAKLIGEKRINSDIRRLIYSPDQMYDHAAKKSEDHAKAFWAAVKNNDSRAAGIILKQLGIDVTILPTVTASAKQVHKSARGYRGRVSVVARPQIVSMDHKSITSYVTEIQRRVGFSASGWAFAARDLGGTRGIVKWKKGSKVKGRKPGGASVKDVAGNYTVTIRNDVPWIDELFRQDQLRSAEQREEKTLQMMIEKAIEANVRKSGFRVA